MNSCIVPRLLQVLAHERNHTNSNQFVFVENWNEVKRR